MKTHVVSQVLLQAIIWLLYFLSLLFLELLALVSLGCQNDIVLQVQSSLVVALEGLEVDNEVVLDSENGVSGQPGVVLGVELGCASLVFGVSDLLQNG
jgi:hypothetical protein